MSKYPTPDLRSALENLEDVVLRAGAYNCTCNCPKAAHTSTVSHDGERLVYTCTASITFEGGFYPCRCKYSAVRNIVAFQCMTCGTQVYLPEPMPYKNGADLSHQEAWAMENCDYCHPEEI
jgi:hypothetical protein